MNNINNKNKYILKLIITDLPIKEIKDLVRQYNLFVQNKADKIKLTQTKPDLIFNLLDRDSERIINQIKEDNTDNNLINILIILFNIKLRNYSNYKHL